MNEVLVNLCIHIRVYVYIYICHIYIHINMELSSPGCDNDRSQQPLFPSPFDRMSGIPTGSPREGEPRQPNTSY